MLKQQHTTLLLEKVLFTCQNFHQSSIKIY